MEHIKRAALSLAALCICFMAGVSFGGDDVRAFDDRVVFVIDAEKAFLVYEGAELIASFPCETGYGGMGKTREGDGKTPVGEYHIAWMASVEVNRGHTDKGSPVIEGMTWCDETGLVYGPEGRNEERLWTDAYGGEDATIMGLDYPNEEDVARGYTGDCIEIHGTTRLVDGKPTRSAGCIKLTAKDAILLYHMVDVGTPVIISVSRDTLSGAYPFFDE
ncbi:MAG: L,D-transpeptidase [Deltaproteobacteria bacterium]|nr:L,D-transpeptidase [Candidatus Zymogenaceae bacterium]